MLICRNAEEVHGQRKVGNAWFITMLPLTGAVCRVTYTNCTCISQCHPKSINLL